MRARKAIRLLVAHLDEVSRISAPIEGRGVYQLGLGISRKVLRLHPIDTGST
jgi:hypothetical protein